jgi:hypothetical protein
MKFIVTVHFLLLFIPAFMRAQDTTYLRDIPSAQEIVKNMQGADALDGELRQVAAFVYLEQAILDLSGDRQWSNLHGLTDAERNKIGEYKAAVSRIYEYAMSRYSITAWEFKHKELKYDSDARFTQQVISQLGPRSRIRVQEYSDKQTAFFEKAHQGYLEMQQKKAKTPVALVRTKDDPGSSQYPSYYTLVILILFLYLIKQLRVGFYRANYRAALSSGNRVRARNAGISYYRAKRGTFFSHGRLRMVDEISINNDIISHIP